MEKKQWVQHVSGQGEKWRLIQQELQEEEIWVAHRGTINTNVMLFLPKSEYRLCDPPEVWRDVTEECSVDHADIRHATECGRNVRVSTAQWDGHGTYRLRKVQLWQPVKETPGVFVSPPQYLLQWAFIVEQKVTE